MTRPARPSKAIPASFLLTAASLALLPATAPLLANQPDAVASDDTADSSGLQEIVVTAQRRSQGVLSVPMSIQAASGEDLQNVGLKSSTDLELVAPGLLVSDSVGYTQVYIRGVGNSIFVGADPSVATYIDDVPRIYGSNFANFVGVERVEVLKGAQGGLYGRNATGGVINIITQQPNTDKFSGTARASYGEMGTYSIAANANVPLSDTIALNVSAQRDAHQAYIDNTATDNPYPPAMFPGGSAVGNAAATAAYLNSGVHAPLGLNRQSVSSLNGKLLFKPVDDFRITLAADWGNKTDDNGNAFRNLTPAYDQAVLGGYLNAFLGANPAFPTGFIQGSNKDFTSSTGVAGAVDDLDWGGSATAVWNAPGVDLTSISAYRVNNSHLITELSGATVPLLEADIPIQRHYWYQELRATSSGSGPWHFLGGGTYLKTHFSSSSYTGFFNVISAHLASTVDEVENYSVYGQAGYDFTHALNLTASGRWVHENNVATYSFPPTPNASTLTEQKFLPSATLSYQFEQGGNTYVRWARGFKSGGINPVSSPTVFPDPNADGGIFQGEQVDTYELGYRAPLLDRTVEITSAVFYNDYKNLQVAAHARPAYAQIIEAIVNAGTARTYGVEGGITWRVMRPLTLGLNAGYLNAKYKTFQIAANNPVLEPFDLSGQTMPNSPTTQVSFTGRLDQPLPGDRIRLVGNVVISHISSVIFSQSGLPGVLPDAVGPAYWLANLRAGIKTSDDKFEVALFINNVTNAAYYTYGSSAAATGTIVNWGNPRVIGGEVALHF